jgi:uncharacterized protein (TIGR04255 family)
MSARMANAPIFYTLGQIRFNPVLNMGEFVPKIHEKIRKQYPAVRQEELRRIQMNLAGQESKDAVSTFSAPRWSFTDLNNTSGYVLYTDSLVYQTTAYETSREFADALLAGIRLVDEVVGLSYVEGVGVRTLDAIMPSADRPLSFYLKPQVLGFHDLVEGDLKHNITENVSALLTGQQVSRVIILQGTIGIPADLFPISLTFAPQFQSVNGLHAILDLDHNSPGRIEFDIEEIELRVRQVKKAVTQVFKSVVTEQALDAWK